MNKERGSFGDFLKIFTPLAFLGVVSLAAVKILSHEHGTKLGFFSSIPNKKRVFPKLIGSNHIKLPTGSQAEIGLFKKDFLQSAFSVKDNPPNKRKKKHTADVFDISGRRIIRLTKKTPEIKVFDRQVSIKFTPKNFKVK